MKFAHSFEFDPAYGYDLAGLLKVGRPEEVADFAEFWQDTYRQTRAVAPEPELTPMASPNPGVDAFEIRFTSLDGCRIGGWLTRPRGVRIARGLVIGHGYGGRSAPDWEVAGPPAAAIFPCCRGLGTRSADTGPGPRDAHHVLRGIQSRDTYIHRGCVADVWAAASALLHVAPQAASDLSYLGASFGGGIGALAVPWETRFRRAWLGVPSFGNHPLRVALPCTGSGEHVRRYRQDHPQVMDVLAYYDAAVAAAHIRIPTYVSAARFDPAVPPPGQFAVHNAIAGPKRLYVLPAAHFDYPQAAQENRKVFAEVSRWLEAT